MSQQYPSPPHQQPQWSQQPLPYQSQPPYQTPPQPIAKKSTLKLWIIFGILGAVVLVGGSFLAASVANLSAGQTVKVGQTITLNGMSATLTGVGGPLSYDAPANGQPADVAAHIKLVNNSNSEQSYSSLTNFHIKSGSGTITGPEIIAPSMYESNDLLGSGNLLPGGTVEGDIIFQITMGDHQAEVTWQPTPVDSDSANGWILGL